MHSPTREPLRIVTEYTTPGGVATRQFADGGALMRICLGHVDNPHDGLIREMESGGEPLPWQSHSAKLEALTALERRDDLDGDLRERLARHVRRAPYYED